MDLSFASGNYEHGRTMTNRAAVAFRPPQASARGYSESIEVHHLVPGGDEVVYQLRSTVGECIDFGKGAQFGVRTKDQIDTCARPLHVARDAVASFEHVLSI